MTHHARTHACGQACERLPRAPEVPVAVEPTRGAEEAKEEAPEVAATEPVEPALFRLEAAFCWSLRPARRVAGGGGKVRQAGVKAQRLRCQRSQVHQPGRRW